MNMPFAGPDLRTPWHERAACPMGGQGLAGGPAAVIRVFLHRWAPGCRSTPCHRWHDLRSAPHRVRPSSVRQPSHLIPQRRQHCCSAGTRTQVLRRRPALRSQTSTAFPHTTRVSFASTLSFQRYSRWDSSPAEASLSRTLGAELFGDNPCPFADLACHKNQRNHCDNRISIHLAPPLGTEHRNEAHPVGTPTGNQHRGAPPEARAPI